MTQSGIEPATFRFVAQHLNHCATTVPTLVTVTLLIYSIYQIRGAFRVILLQRYLVQVV